MRVWLESFRFSGDLFYQDETIMPFRKGITLSLGINHDAGKSENNSNGTGKSRLPQILGAFIYNASDLGHFKKMVLPNFKGTLEFRNLLTNTHWAFTFDLKENAWEILRDGQVHFQFHKASECQKLLADEIGYDRREWSNFVYINRNSLMVLLKSKEPAERRRYLESFFNIDEWYEERRKEFHTRKVELEDQLHLLAQTQARLGQVLDSLSKMEGLGYLSNQIDLLQDSIAIVSKGLSSQRLRHATLATELRTWADYYDVCLKIEGKRPIEELKEDAEKLRNSLADLRERQKRRIQVETKVKTELEPLQQLVARSTAPTAPSVPEPATQDISDLEVLISKMQEKAKLIERFKSVKATVPALDTEETEEALADRRKQHLSRQAEVQLHRSLVKDGKNCTQCGQSLEFILNNQDPTQRAEALKAEDVQLQGEIRKIDQTLSVMRQRKVIREQLVQLKEQIDAYPVFGRSLQEAQQQLADLKSAATAWKGFQRGKQEYDARVQKLDVLEAELRGLGYPEVLRTDFSAEISQHSAALQVVNADLQAAQRHQDLLGKVVDLRPEAELKADAETLNLDLSFNEERSKALSELLGQMKTQRQVVEQLQVDKERLEKELEPSEALQKELQLIEALTKFFGPTGFKLFELRKRCDDLIERANYWSPTFFQEQYEWSLPEDLEKLDFLVQPVRHRSTKPYPAAYLSAGEENRAEKVMLFAQLEMAPPTKSINALFLDEIEGHLDAPGRTVFTEVVVPKLKETFKERAITIISHEESLKRSPDIDHLWLAEKRDRKTTLSVIENYNRRTDL